MSKNPDKITTPVAESDKVVPNLQKRTVETLLADECRWPYGDPLHGDFHFCGKRKKDGSPYCDDHIRQAFQTAKPRAVAIRPLIA